MNQKEIRNFVTKFIENNSTNTDLVDLWNSKDNQKHFNKLFNQKVKKDKNAPKKGLNAYNIFCNEERLKIKEEKPDIDSKSIFKELAVRWNTAKLDESLMERYQQMVLKDKERYNSQLESYVPPENTTKTKNKKNENKPKMPKNAYMFFCEDEREKVKKDKPELKSKDILVELGERWRKIKGTKSSSKYEDKASNDKKRYEIEKAGLASIPEEVPVPINEVPIEEEVVVVKAKAKKAVKKEDKIEKKKVSKK
jgi:hypothetical protein